jgi:hypothetical protein
MNIFTSRTTRSRFGSPNPYVVIRRFGRAFALPLVILSTLGADLMPPTVPPLAKLIGHTNPPVVLITNVVVTWTLSTNWLAGESALTLGTGTNRATLDLSVLMTNLVTGIIITGRTKALPAPTLLPYAASNRVVRPTAAPTELYRAFYGPKSK